ncbi:hypothetical protein DLD77_05740 [Chitinophaga alhagiae]|uniref:Big-1 domain-containing protein n=1 Tax=Chitinophaga alhagiae TaxID=2203219 RepID=A0ABM6WB63_9BACT|nr:hypothetical protein [Chitinophaga alhagiae]AWO01226.1 hypothetical protein DLD77_05740 [Chitinophaga alhagiae]
MPYKQLLLVFFCAFTVMAAGCKKKKKDVPDPVTPPAQEADLVVAIPNIYLNEDRNAAQGSTLGIKVNITSTPPPPSGVTITVTALDPAGLPIAQNPAFDSSTPSTDVTLINLPSLKVASILVTVTSKTKPSNSQQFRFGVLNKTP